MLRLVVNIKLRFAFTFVTANTAFLHQVQMHNSDVIEQNALTSHFHSTVFTSQAEPLMLSFKVVFQGVLGHADILTTILLTPVCVLLVNMREVTLQIQLVSCSEVTIVHRANVGS